MYSIKRLVELAREGLTDLLPALRQAFNRDPSDDRLDLVYGARPRATILGLALAGVVVGALVARLVPESPLREYVNWPAVVTGALFAGFIRRYLFGTGQSEVDDFPWLAASLVPAFFLLMVVSLLAQFREESSTSAVGTLAVAVTDALGVAAALTIAVAALCFSRKWADALKDLAVRLLVFKIMVAVTAFVILEIGIVGPIVTGLLKNIFGLEIPAWLKELADQLTYAGFLSVVYLAVIGATWTVCRNSFGELLETGHVNILDAIVAMAEDPEKKKKKELRKARKRERRAAAKGE